MNKIILIVALATLAACNSGSISAEQDGQTRTEQTEKKSSEKLQLNKGYKWSVDSSTRVNVANINALLQGPPAGRNLQGLGAELQRDVDRLISECRMKGAEHEALHMWLEEFIEHLKELRESPAEREKTYTSLQKDMNEFYEYFE